MAALRRVGGGAFRNGTQHDTAYEAMLLFETGYELADQAASESPIQGETTEHALEGSASGGSPRRRNTLHPARARRGGE
ncbi:MAG: hypothetical protein OXG72_10120 [Acidobacteria bacterium]|nr:hypothetical protein [Acidobacteriota bacterium]